VAFLAPQTARGDLEINLQEVGGPGPMTVVDATNFPSTTVVPAFSFGDFMLALSYSSKNGAGGSFVSSTTSGVMNNSTQSQTLIISVSQNDFMLPGTVGSLLQLQSAPTGTITFGTAQTSVQSYAYNQAILGNMQGGGVDSLFNTTGPTTGLQTTPTVNSLVSTTLLPFSPSDPTTVFSRTSAYYSVTTIATITLAPGGILVLTTTPTLVGLAATPAPAGLVLALTALPALGVGGWLRRRHKKVPASI
jgi:hypothetical protein